MDVFQFVLIMNCLLIHFLFGCWLVQKMQNKHRLSDRTHPALRCSSCSSGQYCAGCCAQKGKSLRCERASKREVQEERRSCDTSPERKMNPTQSIYYWFNETQVFFLPQISPFGYTCIGGAQNLLRQLVHEAPRLWGSLCSPSGGQPQKYKWYLCKLDSPGLVITWVVLPLALWL